MLTCLETWWSGRALPWLNDKTMAGADLDEVRSRVCADLRGDVLEIGFGSGHNVPHYPHEVRRVLAVDPATYGQTLAADRLAASPIPVEFVGLEGESLPLDDASVDAALSTWTLCSIDDVELALAEIHRVLRPGGQLHFVEHGLATDPDTARWQHRITPHWRRVAGGCHLNRPIDKLIAGAGFELCVEREIMRGPKPWAETFVGRATKHVEDL